MSEPEDKTIAAGPAARVREIVEEVLQGSDLYLVDLSIRGRKGSQVVDIFIDRDGPLDVAVLAKVSREIGFLLDTEEVITGNYDLNVSSPGVDRPLAMPRQFRKNVNRILRVKYRTPGEEGVRTVKGELLAADEVGIEIAPTKNETLRILYTDIEEAKVQLPW